MKAGKILHMSVCLFLMGSFAHAQVAPVEPLSLASTMKSMGAKFKQLAVQLNNASLNASSAQLAEEIATGAVASKSYEPDTIANLPPSEKAVKKEQYDQMLDQTAQLCTAMAQALRANDNAQAKALFDQANQEKKDGHSEFK